MRSRHVAVLVGHDRERFRRRHGFHERQAEQEVVAGPADEAERRALHDGRVDLIDDEHVVEPWPLSTTLPSRPSPIRSRAGWVVWSALWCAGTRLTSTRTNFVLARSNEYLADAASAALRPGEPSVHEPPPAFVRLSAAQAWFDGPYAMLKKRFEGLGDGRLSHSRRRDHDPPASASADSGLTA